MTFRHWNQRACQLANALAGLGLARGDRVAVLAYNRVEWAEIFVAAAKAGLIAVPINFRLTGVRRSTSSRTLGATALICEAVLSPTIEAVRGNLDIPGRPFYPDRLRQGGRPVAAIRRPARRRLGLRTGRRRPPGRHLVPDVHLRHHGQPKGASAPIAALPCWR